MHLCFYLTNLMLFQLKPANLSAAGLGQDATTLDKNDASTPVIKAPGLQVPGKNADDANDSGVRTDEDVTEQSDDMFAGRE